jgi:biotin transporter BioY
MLVAFSPLARIAGSTFDSPRYVKPIFGVVTASFVGVMTDHIAGSALGIWYFSLRPEIWYFIMPIYPVERVVALVLASAIAAPVYSSLRRAKLIDFLK